MLKLEDVADIRLIRLDRPPVNALDGALLNALVAELSAAPKAGARGVVLTGVADCYCAGLDLNELIGADAAGLGRFLGSFLDCLHALAASTVPVVAAINGHSPAGGAVLALHCDRRIMREGSARIGLNEVAVGLCPGPLIHSVLSLTIGARRAGEMLTTGVMLSSVQALEIGLVDEVVPKEQVETSALSWLRGVLALPSHAYATTRRMVRQPLVSLLENATGTHRAATLAAIQQDWMQDETRATLSAMLARRSSGR
jgi:1,4-dihydroxy-2-naphthoyl-CoA synthase